jgi:ribosomal protein S10
MPFSTELTLSSGDVDRLEAVVEDIKHDAKRKGVALNGPHAEPATQLHVPQFKGTPGQGRFDAWQYTIYTRRMEVLDHPDFARTLLEREYPDPIRVEADVTDFSHG